MSHGTIIHQRAEPGNGTDAGFECLSLNDLERRALCLAAVSKRVPSPDVAGLLQGYAREMMVEARGRTRALPAPASRPR